MCCFGILNFSDGLNGGNGYLGEVESVEGQELLAKAFPEGNAVPTDIVVPDPARAEAVAAAVGRVDGVAGVRPAERGAEGRAAARDARATTRTRSRRRRRSSRSARRRRQAGGPDVLVGGQTAVQLDGREAATRDTLLIVPIALVIVFLILMVLLRAVIAPLLLIGTVILSFGAALGRQRGRLRRDLRLPRLGRVAAAVRVHLPGGAGHRLQHLPDGARARGDAAPRHARGHDPRPRGDRRR